MQKVNRKHAIKRTVDIIMIVLLLLLMAYQVTGGAAHEWMGLAMAVLVIIHQILNLQWYRSLLKGKYPAARVAMNLTDIFLIIAFILTVYCGMSMSGYAVPFLYGMGKISFVRRTHLSVSYWLFVLMGIHLGFHIRAMFIKSQYSGKKQTAVSICFAVIAAIGFWIFLKNNIPGYLLFRMAFGILDYEKAAGFVLLENVLMLLFWVFAGWQIMILLQRSVNQEKKKKRMLSVVYMGAVLLIGFLLNIAVEPQDSRFGNASEQSDVSGNNTDDGYILINGGSFQMGSPSSDIMNQVFEELNKQGIETELVQFAGQVIAPCKACWACGEQKNCVHRKDIFRETFDKMMEADGILLGSPVYSANISAGMQAFLQRAAVVCDMNRGSLDMKYKVGASVAALRRGGAMPALDAMNHFFLNQEMIVVGSTYWNMVYGQMPGDVSKDEEGLQTMKNLGINMAYVLHKLKS